jgi:ferritin
MRRYMIMAVMTGNKIETMINEQIKHEFESEQIYRSMAAWMHSQGWHGMAQWLHVQANEEKNHAMRFYDHLIGRGIKVELLALEEPKRNWNSPIEAFKDAYEHEKFITGKINDLVVLSQQEKDHPASVMLQWFVEEQVEEESSTYRVVQMLERVKDNVGALIILDQQLGKREG